MLQTAVVGVGFIGAEHIEAIRRTNLATVAAIVGRSPEQTEQKAKALGIPAFYTDYDAVLQDPSIQVIHICTTPWQGRHYSPENTSCVKSQ